jgi:hypothetical protein
LSETRLLAPQLRPSRAGQEIAEKGHKPTIGRLFDCLVETLTAAPSPPPYDEFRNAFFGYYAYWGTYTINDAGTGVVHNVQGSERPGEVGVKYERFVSIDGTKLVITTPSYKAGLALPHDRLEQMQIPADEELVNRLTFERIE